MELIAATWQRTKTKVSAPGFLTQLGVEFRKPNGTQASFFVRNEAELEYIYADMCARARLVKAQLHPQNGGDPHVFSDFCSDFDRVCRSFVCYGVKLPGHALAAINNAKAKREIERAKAETPLARAANSKRVCDWRKKNLPKALRREAAYRAKKRLANSGLKVETALAC